MKRKDDTEDMSDDTKLTYEEENAIRYMSGYVIHKLQNKHIEVNFLILDKASVAVSEVESSDWINLIDRGGLVHVTDDCFQLFLSKCAIRRNLDKFSSKKLHVQENESFCNYMENKVSSDDGILFDWMMITGDEKE